MYIVGLTGGIGSGKSTIAKFFMEKNIALVDADQLARQVVSQGTPALSKITDKFGPRILKEDGLLNRKILRKIVFNDKTAKIWLEELLHPLIKEALVKFIDAADSKYLILESPLLLETNQHNLVDRILVVDVSEATQLKRTYKRDGGSKSTIKAIMNSQLSRTDRLDKADDIVNNERPVDSIEKELESLHTKYISLAQKK